jgi:flagellar biogenesis protein FliO
MMSTSFYEQCNAILRYTICISQYVMKNMINPVKKILENLLSHHNNWQLQLLQNWPTIVGSIRTKVQLLKIQEDTLVIGVLDSCWLQELYLLSPLLIKTINEKLDQPRIKKLRFKTVGITDKEEKKKAPLKRITTKNVQLSIREQETLNQIKDEQLRRVLKEYLMRCHRENV